MYPETAVRAGRPTDRWWGSDVTGRRAVTADVTGGSLESRHLSTRRFTYRYTSRGAMRVVRATTRIAPPPQTANRIRRRRRRSDIGGSSSTSLFLTSILDPQWICRHASCVLCCSDLGRLCPNFKQIEVVQFHSTFGVFYWHPIKTEVARRIVEFPLQFNYGPLWWSVYSNRSGVCVSVLLSNNHSTK